MGEEEAIQRTTGAPVTVDSIESDLRNLGIEAGDCVLVHSSLSSMGWVCGGAVSVILALEAVIRPYGILVMPTHTGDLSDPSGWEHPPVPEEWWDEIRRSMPPYDPEFSPTRGMGVVSETFRKQPDVVRSNHPQLSFCAWGDECLSIAADHALEYGLGEDSPLARIYDRDGWVLLIGVGHERNTSLHLAETRAEYPEKPIIPCSAPVQIDGHTRWKTYEELDYSAEDFAELGHDFMNRCKHDIRLGAVGYAKAQLFRQRVCVDFAMQWFHRNRR